MPCQQRIKFIFNTNCNEHLARRSLSILPFQLKATLRTWTSSFSQKETGQVSKNKVRRTQLQNICCKTSRLILQRWRPFSSMRCSRCKHKNFIFPYGSWDLTLNDMAHIFSVTSSSFPPPLSPSRTKQSSQSVYNAEEFPCGPGM